ncbi:DUF5777 family beta-barrel protein [Mucilaginibacter pedocola]|uniref:DUF5777 domain-containing protein n=1 Tax=Mucilaginibacter pedocola TaxID=1792845 RepID=A0A1S9P8I4_9SPHI|nr:DUF5777 family beta-barrel protein [Mucilaginibacter pedocola]OOQ57286.1 hypothetical protein BC343_14310 [Mucilaginibacter pedocola]
MKKLILIAACAAISTGLCAQTKPAESKSAADSLLNSMDAGNTKAEPVIATFKSTRLILGATTETVKKNNLNFLVIHRFGDIGGSEGGGKTLFGLDNSSDIYIGFEYGLSDNLDIDFGRSKYNQQVDLGLKYAMLHQTSDDATPFAITLLGKTGVKAYTANQGEFPTFADRLDYVAQAIIARKFSSNFSLQLTPTFVRHNSPFPFLAGNNRGFFALGAAGRLKVTKRMGIVVDYAHPFSSFRDKATGDNAFYDPLGIGIEIETGGHVFTIVFSNTKAISEASYLAGSQSDWGKGQFRLGFTISRMFSFNKKAKEGKTY